MVRSLTEPLTDAASQAALRADHEERDREARNLPRASVPAFRRAHRDGLDWDHFRDVYYPDSRRHNFEAIVAYGAYKRSHHGRSQASEAVPPKSDARSIVVHSNDVDVW
jgi:hypothetical protein